MVMRCNKIKQNSQQIFPPPAGEDLWVYLADATRIVLPFILRVYL